MNTGLYPILTLISRLDVMRLSDSREHVDMHPFRTLIQRCMNAKIWKVRAMAARCLPVVLDQETLSDEISSIFGRFRIDAQNELHGGLMGIKCLSEFYSCRTLRDVVYGIHLVDIADLDAIISGMQHSLKLILRENRNPLTKAAFVEILHQVSNKEKKASELRRLALDVCLHDLRSGQQTTVGWQMYLEQAASLVLDTLETPSHSLDEPNEEILELLLGNENEEVVLKTLLWMNTFGQKYVSIENIACVLHNLVYRDSWDGVCAQALRAVSKATGENKIEIGLAKCVQECKKDKVMPVKEGWITMAGYAARKVCSPFPRLTKGIHGRINR